MTDSASSSAALAYRLSGVRKVYGDRVALQADSLDIRLGEILAVVGPSGAGKSTLLRLLNFLEPATAGEIEFLGQPVGDGSRVGLAMRRQVTTVFQRPVLLSRSVHANVAYGLHLRGRRGRHGIVEAALEQVGLSQIAHQPARTLSGGEAQRVALARALVIEPRVLLLDEPTANLDPYNIGVIESITRQLNQERRTTIVLVTHNVFQAKRLAHRVVLLLGGQIVEVAGVQQFFEAPADPRTRAFVNGELVY
jgi:tungstate transport system ATP-binding protein